MTMLFLFLGLGFVAGALAALAGLLAGFVWSVLRGHIVFRTIDESPSGLIQLAGGGSRRSIGERRP